ncbi:DUF1385 domain-containing protein [Eubacterium oxidoreducens]|uniref:Uncharacterized conserved protein YqhQ n=1 Tax=Eubacterium oxidoreducens TaxID=1732 RepID=A0A1G6BF05_EUBOX|nr:DUF1385 domain-containing protein [Eubacterium oxidoreducens]SDB19194.1 Uncharacterized conserved protein YqhQ [Eubacterium oxidoreducens]
MKYSGIGGQAVMEGVMMRNKDCYAVAVRKTNGQIVVKQKQYKGICRAKWVQKIPLVRGVINFIDSMYLGISTLMLSAGILEEDEEKEKTKKEESKENLMMGGTVVVSLLIAIGVFMLLPFYASVFLGKIVESQVLISIFEAVLRLVIFLGYLLLISQLEDIQRVFMYHGAEHKCINCIEHGMELNVENVRKSSRQHKRCGTSFLFIVIIISIIFFIFIQTDSHMLKLVSRLILIPVVAGVSYELLRWFGMKDGKLSNVLSKPGLKLQNLTTREPDDSMIEVGIASVEAVFDWREYLTQSEEGCTSKCRNKDEE